MTSKIFQTLIAGYRCNITSDPGGFKVVVVRNQGIPPEMLVENLPSEIQAITEAEKVLGNRIQQNSTRLRPVRA